MKEGCAVEIHVKGPCGQEITGQTMDEVVTFIYTEAIVLNGNNIFELLLASDYMQIASIYTYTYIVLILQVHRTLSRFVAKIEIRGNPEIPITCW